jgi:hypothetical protein
MKITEAMLAAYVDGELAAPEQAEVEAAVALDPQVAARLKRHQALKGQLAGVFAATLDEAAPDALVAMISGSAKTGSKATAADNVVSLAKARTERAQPTPKPPRAWVAWAALAAGFVLVVVMVQAKMAPAGGPGGGQANGPMIAFDQDGMTAKGALAHALDKQLTADQAKADPAVKILVSFRATDGRYCRSFQIERGPDLAGVACRDTAGWRVNTAVTSPPPSSASTQYRTAGSTTPTAVLDSVSALIAGQALDASGESAAVSKGWLP